LQFGVIGAKVLEDQLTDASSNESATLQESSGVEFWA